MHVSTVSAGEEQHSGGSATPLHRCGSTLQPSNPVCFRSMLALCHDLMSVLSFLHNACRVTPSSRSQDRQKQRACLWCFGVLSQPAVSILDLQHPSSATCIICEPNPYHAAHCSTCVHRLLGINRSNSRTCLPAVLNRQPLPPFPANTTATAAATGTLPPTSQQQQQHHQQQCWRGTKHQQQQRTEQSV